MRTIAWAKYMRTIGLCGQLDTYADNWKPGGHYVILSGASLYLGLYTSPKKYIEFTKNLLN